MIINYIRVPFISAFSIDDYVESLTLGIAPSGEYIEGRVASDSFTGYLTGFNAFFSGSGYWLTSGSTQSISTYLNDAFSGYGLGDFRYNALNAGFIYQGYSVMSGSTTGNLYIISNQINDSFVNYPTGTYSTFTGNVYQAGYIPTTGSQTGVTYGFVTSYTGGGGAGGGGGASSSGNYWVLTDSSNVSPSYGYINNGYRCTTGSYAYYATPSGAIGNSGVALNDYTVEFWMKRDGWGFQADVLAETNTNLGFSVVRSVATDKLNFYSNGSILQGSGTVPNNTWCHVAAVRQGSGLRLYFSGILDSNNPSFANSGQLSANYTLTIGASAIAGGTPFVGNIDEFRLWNYARSQAEISTNMNTQIVSAPGLVNYLTFDS